ncbi:aspartyl-phosphate phosphatase Spo0E family protein [Sporosarcina sp. Sa2YVA2]|uniref:Aspartyl-phosphate phosphatase Spo0E family protein n=1 Tax=Sporosarcina quadrami TaxID=2762234 RepID=A0ABR8U764_9BACL|nr:aspartyl-phosphate phosphatase Spo0E family protein [Sporosarcina quadrami]MBD7983625.1 aspartyl-phosphate phosphatase Spo0E family protein [Sporosarcina quadrami]
MKIVTKRLLSLKIQIKRSQMVKKALDQGFTHPEVVAYSQQLDTLLNRYQNIA